jgi:WD40 repeat protein
VRALLALFPLALQAASPPVTALAFSPDGKLLAAGGNQQVQIWDAASNKLLRSVGECAGRVRALAFRDARTLALASGVPGRSGAVSLLDLDTGGVVPVQQANDEVLAVAFSPDGNWLATGATDGIVRVYEGTSLKKELKGHTDWITGVAFSPDGKLLASASADRTARVWMTSDWREEFQLPAQVTEPVSALAFSLEGDLLAFATGGTEEHAVRWWRTQAAFAEIDSSRPNMKRNLSQTRAIDTDACVPLSVSFVKSQPRSRLIVGCTDLTVRVLGPNGNAIATLTGPAAWVYAVAASPDGRTIAAGSGDGSVRFWIAGGGTYRPAAEPRP